ncbi:MAG: PepSY domain-containing protein [Aridibacter sp.]
MNKKIGMVLGLIITLAVGGAVIAKSTIGSVWNKTASGVSQDKVTKEEARKIALKRVKGKIVDEEYEKENGRMVYGFEIKQADGTVMEVKVDEITGKVIFVGKDDGDEDENGKDDEDSMSEDNDGKMSDEMKDDEEENDEDEAKESEEMLMKQAKITKAQAEKIALKKAPGKVEERELENENNILVYSFDIRNKKGTITEVQVDAKTGKIVSVQEENAAKEASEKAEDNKKKEKPNNN